MDQVKPSLLTLFGEALKRLFADEAIPLAGNFTFRMIFSLFPFLIFATSLAGFFGSEDLVSTIVNFLLGVAPEDLVKPFAGEIRSILTVPRTGLLSLAALLTIWSAMGGVDSVRIGLNRAYGVTETRPVWLILLIDVIFVIGGAVWMLAFSGLLVVIPALDQFINTYAPQWQIHFNTLEPIRVPLAVLILLFGLLVAHRFLPNRILVRRDVLPGILTTVVVWVAITAGFGWYLQHFNSFASTYASLSGLFATMFLIYQAGLALIFGGEVNRVLMIYREQRKAEETAHETD
ncbi:YihY/virulence factor BrkB family protein [Aestuariivirga litoralis]|uniref:YihY/virulence factor BrkB family protein n=1 Tax=Aestuariivirga litoralis TaxID=2650924 RepID=UPI0018C62CB3|nr:YihY/virulence factor BrkB family protein [Aestuariivirga litoralis]MBG1233529.1 YihY/virulence factor BrkB family protein [Aestuariivirga litoralis]